MNSMTVLCWITAAVLLTGNFVKGEEELTISIEPSRLTIEVGSDHSISCKVTGEQLGSSANVTSINWINPNGTDIGLANSSRVVYGPATDDINERAMAVKDAQINDGGQYLCLATLSVMSEGVLNTTHYNKTFQYKVYVMPTYFTEGMIILGVNLGLLLLFSLGLIKSYMQDKHRMSHYGQIDG